MVAASHTVAADRIAIRRDTPIPTPVATAQTSAWDHGTRRFAVSSGGGELPKRAHAIASALRAIKVAAAPAP